jgi:transposase InsO family protein
VSVFVDEHRGRFGVEPICRALGVSASAYYERASGRRSARSLEDERLLELIRGIHERNYFAYGSWRVWKTLQRSGEQVGRGRVERLMRSNGIRGAKRRGKPWRTTIPDAEAPPRPDLVQRDFSRMIVGWQFAEHMRTDLVLDALRMALHLRGPGADVELIHHSDAGSQYGSYDYTQTLDDHHVLASVGSVGNAYDNALAESLVDSFKTELIRDRVWRTRSQLELAIVE